MSVIVPDRDATGRLFSVRQSMEEGVHHFRIAVPSPFHRLIGFYAPSLLARIIADIAKHLRPDVIHAHAARPAGVLAEIALRNLSVPWCLTEHSSPLVSFWKTGHGWRQIARAYSRATRLFAVSSSLRIEMQYNFGEVASSAQVLYNGINTDYFKPMSEAPGAARLLFVGGLEPKKGVDTLLLALARLPPSCSWGLSIVGKGRLEGALRRQAEKLGIGRQITWLGGKSHAEMPSIYAAHDILVVPSTHETFSLVCAEALACARPVIATRCGGPEEVVPTFGGALVPPGDCEALMQVLSGALSGKLDFDAARAVSHVRKNFSMTALLDRLEETYHELSGRGY